MTFSQNSSDPVRLVACPTCRKMGAFAPSNPFRPFCSERCRIQDRAQWATESYRIPTQLPPEEEEISSASTGRGSPQDSDET